MSRRIHRRAALPIFVVGLVFLAAAWGDGELPRDPPQVAEHFLAAFAAGDGDGMDALASDAVLETADAFQTAALLLLRHVQGVLSDPPPAERALDAAEAWARRVSTHPGSRRLPELVAAWRRLDRDGLERELRVRETLLAVVKARGRGDWAEIHALASKARGDVDAAVTSVWAVMIVLLRGDVWLEERRLEEAAAAYRDAAARAATLGWGWYQGDALLRAGKAHYFAGDMESAHAAWAESGAAHEVHGWTLDAVRALGNVAVVHQMRGELDDALAVMQRVLALQEAAKDHAGMATSLGNMAVIHDQQGRWEDALTCQKRSLAIEVERGHRPGQAECFVNLGNTYLTLGRRADAMDAYLQARAIFEELELAHESASVRANIARLHLLRGQIDRARELFREAVAVLSTRTPSPHLGSALVGAGTCHRRLGSYAEALSALERAVTAHRRMEDREGETQALGALGSVYRELGLETRALERLEQALASAEAMGARPLVLELLTDVAAVHGEAGRYAEALAIHERVYEEAERIGYGRMAVVALTNIATCLSSQGEHGAARPILERALVLGRERGLVLPRAGIQRSLGIVLWHLGEEEKGLAQLDASLAFSESLRDAPGTIAALESLAELRAGTGRSTEALTAARRAVALRLDSTRGLGTTEASGVRSAGRMVVNRALSILAAQAVQASSRVELLGEFLWFSEAGRSLSLLEGLLNRAALRAALVPADASDAEAAARDDVRRLHEHLLERAAVAAPDPDALEVARGDVDAAYARLERAVAVVEREARRGGDLVDPRPAALTRIRAALPEDGALLLYQILGPDEAAALVVTKQDLHLVPLGSGTAILEGARRLLRLLSVEGSDDAAEARSLYDRLVAPLLPHLEGVESIVVAPDDVLAFVPFGTLLGDDDGKARRLLERWEVAYVPSGTVLAALHEHEPATSPGRNFLAVGDPVPPRSDTSDAAVRGLENLGRLPATAEEVEAIADLFDSERCTVLLAESATREMLMAAFEARPSRLRALHLACHGHVDTQRPHLTGLVLSGGTFLSLADLYRLEIPADLVVLSACDSGRGVLQRSEGVVGLVSGFLHAGASRVVVSNWAVSDESTRDLMVAFYEKFIRESVPAAEALRRAKLDLLARGGKSAHPYHWAGFVLWGLPE